MEFGKKIREIREERGLTQAQFAEKLAVTRQAVSNWENEKNLPDIEMLINIAKSFQVSLDELILGGNDMNKMTEKLINDGSEVKKAKYNAISLGIAFAMLVIGMGLMVIKALSVEYIDDAGILHENFFLIPIAMIFILGSVVAFMVTGARNVLFIMKNKGNRAGKSGLVIIACALAVAIIFAAVALIVVGNNIG